jgi:hypothetical protein
MILFLWRELFVMTTLNERGDDFNLVDSVIDFEGEYYSTDNLFE